MVIPVWFWVWLAIASVMVYVAWLLTQRFKRLDEPTSAAALMKVYRDQSKKQLEVLQERAKRTGPVMEKL